MCIQCVLSFGEILLNVALWIIVWICLLAICVVQDKCWLPNLNSSLSSHIIRIRLRIAYLNTQYEYYVCFFHIVSNEFIIIKRSCIAFDIHLNEYVRLQKVYVYVPLCLHILVKISERANQIDLFTNTFKKKPLQLA